MDQYLSWIKYDRQRREILYNFGGAVAKVKGEFSYLRLEGLNQLLRLMAGLSSSKLAMFLTLQDYPDKNVASSVYSAILAPKDAPRYSPILVQEKQKALEILAGLFLMHSKSKEMLVFLFAADIQRDPLKVFLDLLDVSHPQLQVVLLETLISFLIGSISNQQAFAERKGTEKIFEFKQQKLPDELRAKCEDFLSSYSTILNENEESTTHHQNQQQQTELSEEY